MEHTGNEQRLSLSFFMSLRTVEPRVREFTWLEIIHAFRRTRYASRREEIQLVSPAMFWPAQRRKENVQTVSIGVFDIDQYNLTGEAILRRMKAIDCFVVETWHSTPEDRRWRLVVCLVAPVPVEDYDELWSRVNHRLGHCLDPSTKDASRMFFLPSAQVGERERDFHHQMGRPLDWRELEESPSLAPPRRPRNLSLPSGNEDRRAAGMVESWGFKLGQWQPGSRHQQLLNFARAGGGLVAAGLINEQTVIDVLFRASEENYLVREDGEQNVLRTITDGLKNGAAEPWTPAGAFGDRMTWRQPGPRLGQRQNGTVDLAEEEPLPDATTPEIPVFPLGRVPAKLREVAESATFPVGYSMGGALGVAAIAIGGNAEIATASGLHERAILWVAILGEASTGKSKAIDRCKEILDHFQRERDGAPLTIRSLTLESLMRELPGAEGALGVVHGELSAFLAGIGQYKRSATADEAEMLELWSGSPASYIRVGAKARMKNEVRIFVDRPTVTVVGGIVTDNAQLLGTPQSGMRSRWLPFIGVPLPPDVPEREDGVPAEYRQAIEELLDLRPRPRTWLIRDEAEVLFQKLVRGWRERARWPETPRGIAVMLERSSQHLLRICLTLAEIWKPGGIGLEHLDVPFGIVDEAHWIFEYCARCWMAIDDGSAEYLALSIRDEKIDTVIRLDILPLLRRSPGGRMKRRDLQIAKAGGKRSAADFKAMMDRYAALYPGCVRQEGQAVWVYAPAATPSTLFDQSQDGTRDGGVDTP